MRDTNFNRHFDLDAMLSDNAVWLVEQTGLTFAEFREIAGQLSMTQGDWTIFWQMIKEIGKKDKGEIEVTIRGRDEVISEKRFQVLQIALGDPKEYSNCCYSDVYSHNADDHTSRCSDCGEGCGIVYIF